MQEDVAVELVEKMRHRRRILLALGRNDRVADALGRGGGQLRPQRRAQQVEGGGGLHLVVVALREPHDVMEKRGEQQLRRKLAVLRLMRHRQVADAAQMPERMEVSVGLQIGIEHHPQPLAAHVQAVVVEGRQQLPDVADLLRRGGLGERPRDSR